MPELPEVQTIVNFLHPKVLGRKILDLQILSKRITKGFNNSEIPKIVGQKIVGIDRVGKWIVLKLSSRKCFLFHLMMTGKLLLNPSHVGKHDRIILKLSGGDVLVFNDIRQFGKCRLVDSVENLVGPDALKISLPDFKKILESKNKPIKNFLLDQKNISGLGNIYTDEVLWEAGIHPLRKTNSFKSSEIFRLLNSIKKVLKLAIKKGGTSSRDYRKPDDTEGEYYNIRRAYQRTGEKCSRCRGVIKRIVVGGRSTHYCPKHQK